MGLRQKLEKNLRSAACDKEGLNRRILKWCRCFREVEKMLGCCKPGKHSKQE